MENELEAKTAKLLLYQTENEELRVKRISPTTQLKQTIDELREELKQKDSIINSLSKTIKDDRAMRASSAQKRPKDQTTSRDKKVDNELFQEIANLRTISETQKKTINSFEITKWDLEKNLKEARDLLKNKIKEKDIEISELKAKLEKLKIRLNKNENDKQLLQNKVLKKENIQRDHKSTQITPQNQNDLIKLKNELKKVSKFN